MERGDLWSMLSGGLNGKETQKRGCRTSLGAQWVCIHLPVRAHWLPPLSGDIPRGAEQLSPWAAATEPARRSCCAGSPGCAGSSLPCGLCSSCREPGLFSSCHAGPSHPGGFSCCRARV